MRKMTEDNLRSAFAGESQAHVRYLIFADKAEQEGFSNVARLFRAVAYAEQVHATNHYSVLGMIRGTVDNLQVAIDGETFEVTEMYPAYKAVAELQEERGLRGPQTRRFKRRRFMLACIRRLSRELKEKRTLC